MFRLWKTARDHLSEELLTVNNIKILLNEVCDSCLQALLLHCRRNSPHFADNDAHTAYLDSAGAQIADIYFLFEAVEAGQGEAFIEMLTNELVKRFRKTMLFNAKS